jgi:hypothetical protein
VCRLLARSRGYKKSTITEKMFETMAIFRFTMLFFHFFLAQRKADLHVGGFIFMHST